MKVVIPFIVSIMEQGAPIQSKSQWHARQIAPSPPTAKLTGSFTHPQKELEALIPICPSIDMFAQYSAFALCLSLVFALDVLVPPNAQAGASLTFNVSGVQMHPAPVDLLLCVSDGKFYITLETNTTVAPIMVVDIPANAPERPDYFFAATAVRDRGIIYSKSNLFAIESA
ncbi:hypothetical protein V8E55_011669 [Tylopilus felleus]